MLEEFIEKTKQRIENEKKTISLEDLKKEVSRMDITMDFPFKKALSEDGISIIAEIKKASPSKGGILTIYLLQGIMKMQEPVQFQL